MGKVVLFAVLTMDGCLADSSGEAQKWLSKTDTPDRFGIAEMKETARPLSEYTSLTMLVLDKTATTYFIEANATTASIINGMARMHLLDEIILCTIPVIAGNGCRLFLGDLPESEWIRDEIKAYKDGSLKAVYRKSDGASVQKMNVSLLKRLFRVPQERRRKCSENERFPAQKTVQKVNTCSLSEHLRKSFLEHPKLFSSIIPLFISLLQNRSQETLSIGLPFAR